MQGVCVLAVAAATGACKKERVSPLCAARLDAVSIPTTLDGFDVVAESSPTKTLARRSADHYATSTKQTSLGPFVVEYEIGPRPVVTALEVREAACEDRWTSLPTYWNGGPLTLLSDRRTFVLAAPNPGAAAGRYPIAAFRRPTPAR